MRRSMLTIAALALAASVFLGGCTIHATPGPGPGGPGPVVKAPPPGPPGPPGPPPRRGWWPWWWW